MGEDNFQVSFARRVLLLLGFSRHEIITRPVPDGRGSGEQWVRTDYPNQVAINRQQRTFQSCILLVSIDADQQSIQERKLQLDHPLVGAGMNGRGDTEPFAIWVPTRNIETWFKYFTDDEVAESADYKRKIKQPNFKHASQSFVEEFRRWEANPEDVDTLPSLLDAYQELTRIC